MNPKNLKILIALFIGILLIAAMPWIKEKTSSDEKKPTKKISIDFSNTTKSSVDKIKIEKGEESVTLIPKDDAWLIEETKTKADSAKINSLFASFSEIEILELASKNKENQNKFQVSAETATKVTLTQNGTESLFFIGKRGSSINSFFIRKEKIANVYLVTSNLKTTLFTTATEWEPVPEEEPSDVQDDPSSEIPSLQ